MRKEYSRTSVRYRRNRGQSLVELTLALPFLFLLLLGVFEFGLLLYAHAQVSNAVREGAWAASHFRASRYLRVTKDASGTPASCNGVAGWSLDQAVRQAIVYRSVDASGCPQDAGSIVYHSLGILDPQPTPSWSVTVTASLDAEGMPTPADPGQVTLDYPYRLLLISNLFPYLTDPMTIRKSVAFEYLQ